MKEKLKRIEGEKMELELHVADVVDDHKMKMGCAGAPLEPHRRLQAGMSGDPRSQNADRVSWNFRFN